MLAILPLLLAAPQSTWYVDAGGVPPGSGSLADPYTSVAYAVAQTPTLPGDTVHVHAGTYLDEEVDFLGKDVLVRSADGPSVTELVAPAWPGSGPRPSVVHLTSGETRAALLEGFTLRGGLGASNSAWGPAGGGVTCIGSGATIRDCVFVDQQAAAGGGLYAANGDLLIEDCTFTLFNLRSVAQTGDGALIVGGHATFRACSFLDLLDSTTGQGGGALAIEDATALVEGCTFDLNLNTHGVGNHVRMVNSNVVLRDSVFVRSPADHGAALASTFGTLVVDGCEVAGSWAYQHDGGGLHASGTELYVYRSWFHDNRAEGVRSGGGLYLESGSATLVDTLFESNVANRGGGIALITSDTIISGCTIRENRNVGCPGVCFGGGIFASAGTLLIERTVFDGNEATSDTVPGHGGGIYSISTNPTIDHCTFVANRSGGEGKAISGGLVTNSIIYGSNPDPVEAAGVDYSLVEGGYPLGVGNHDGDPSFWSNHDLHLLPDSDAIDGGDATAPLDADGTRTDVGAFAFDAWHCGTGCTGPVGTPSCAALPSSTGFPATLHALGASTVATNRLVLNATELPPNALGYLLAGQTPGFVFHFGGSQGILCLSGNILRFSSTILSAGQDGTMSFRADLNAFPRGTAVLPGDTWYFQTWFRDIVNGNQTSNTTQSMRVVFD
ncbi:MAG: right-handed parallel beta-helix repeat-containing protein [bacterium]|nr:right-handed parallel beta-helix repeat-containing protein [bacterium]